ncbi:hypothetical protein EC988_009041, partial [Linderina pennispora]
SRIHRLHSRVCVSVCCHVLPERVSGVPYLCVPLEIAPLPLTAVRFYWDPDPDRWLICASALLRVLPLATHPDRLHGDGPGSGCGRGRHIDCWQGRGPEAAGVAASYFHGHCHIGPHSDHPRHHSERILRVGAWHGAMVCGRHGRTVCCRHADVFVQDSRAVPARQTRRVPELAPDLPHVCRASSTNPLRWCYPSADVDTQCVV